MSIRGVPRFLRPPEDPQLDLDEWIGQRQVTFTYEVINGRTGMSKGFVTPRRSTIPVLTHNTANTIMRTLTGFNLGVEDTLTLEPLTDRIVPRMVLNTPNGEVAFPLGRYMYDSSTLAISTGGNLSTSALFDEMFIVDQALPAAFSITAEFFGSNAAPSSTTVDQAIATLLRPLTDAGLISFVAEGSPFIATGSWPAGTSRAQVLSDLCRQGSYFQPWFDNHGIMQIIRSFNPAEKLASFNYDDARSVFIDTISYTNDLLDAPNRFVVIDNSGTTDTPIVGFYDIPSTAPQSIARRGFVIPKVLDIQGVGSQAQVDAMAQTVAEQATVFERTVLSTPPDPRHESYDVIFWGGGNWMEIGWSMQMVEGGPTVRTLRKAYA